MTIKVEAYGIRNAWAKGLCSVPSKDDIDYSDVKEIEDIEGLRFDVDEEIDDFAMTDVQSLEDEDDPYRRMYYFDILLTVKATIEIDTDDVCDHRIGKAFYYLFSKVYNYEVTKVPN